MSSLKLYGSAGATANSVASVIVPSATRIRGVQFAAIIDCNTDNGTAQVEVSRASAREIAVNGAQQAIAEIWLQSNFVTSGLAQYGVNEFFPVDVPVVQGQIIYLHIVIAGTVTCSVSALLWY